MSALLPGKHSTPVAFFFAVNRKEIPWIALNMLLYSIGGITLILLSYLLGKIIDALTLHSGISLAPLLWMSLGLVVLYEVGYRLGHLCEIRIRTRLRARTKKVLFDHTRTLSFGYFADRFAGEISHKVTMAADAFERLLLVITNNVVEDLVLIIVSSLVLGSISIWYAVFLLAWTLCFVGGLTFFARHMDEKAGAWAIEETRTTGALVDVYGNIGAVKVFGKGEDTRAVHQQIDAEARALLALGKWDVLMYNFAGIFIILLVGGFMWISALLYTDALITVGALVTVTGVGFRLYGSVWELGPRLAEFIRYRGEVRQNLTDLVVAPLVLDGEHAAPTAALQVGVEYKDVVFGYGQGEPILNGFSLMVKPGEKVGIVGLSGAGKTTFANLLLRFFDTQGGSIRLNGVYIREFTQEFLRSHISYISQDTSLFHDTISKNIAYGADAASQADVEHAAKLAYAHEFIETLPHKYKSIVGERGIKLSGGQRQRITIARALLADRPLFLLDEATSALDTDSEQKIQKGLEALMEGKTVIAIAHRLSTLSHMDRIIFMEGGKIIEDGTHEELLALEGKYANLWQKQAGGFLPSEIATF